MFSVDVNTKVEFASGNLIYISYTGFCFVKAPFMGDAANTWNGDSATLFGIDHKVVQGQMTSMLYPECRSRVELNISDIKFPPTDAVAKSEFVNIDINQKWRLLKAKEWDFLLKKRLASTVSGIKNARFIFCTVRGTAGLLLFPDEYVHSERICTIPSSSINHPNQQFGLVSFKYTDWTKLEQAGCVFLPAAGFGETNYLGDMEIKQIGVAGCYWTASHSLKDENIHGCFAFGCRNPGFFNSMKFGVLPDRTDWFSNSVRLVRDISSSNS